MKRLGILSVILFSLFGTTALAQENGYLDSLKHSLETAKTAADRIDRLEKLTSFYMAFDRKLSDKYLDQIQEIAERSRDRNLMVRALVIDARRFYVVGVGNRDDGIKALKAAERALDLAKSNGLDDAEAEVYILLARIARSNGESDKALNFNNMALSLAGTSDNDSVHVDCLISLGDTYMLKKERLLAFRNYLQALTLAEEFGHYEPLKASYHSLADFYQELGEYEKAKDYFFKLYALTIKYKQAFDRMQTYRSIGFVYTLEKRYDIATGYYEKVLALADSMKFNEVRVNGYLSILEQYRLSGQPEKALAYLKSRADLREFMIRVNAEHLVYQAYGLTYQNIGRYDSAKYYYAMAEPLFEARSNPERRFGFYTLMADLYSTLKQHDKALSYLQKAKDISEESGNLDMKQVVSLALDSAYQKLGDFKSAYFYNEKYHTYADSLKLLATEKDLMILEVADETKRREREELKTELELHARHNIQYMGITLAIASVFIMLIMLGIFRTSKATIKVLGFFAFIFLFEFIILLADNQIHHWTHGEPWKVMLIKIALISLLLPLHHYLEEKVIHYLTSHQMLAHKDSLLSKLRRERVSE